MHQTINQLNRQGDLRHQIDRPRPPLDNLSDQFYIDLGFTTTGHPMQ